MGRLNHDTKLEIIDMHKSGKRVCKIVRNLNIQGQIVSKQRVSFWIKNYQNGYFNPSEKPNKVKTFKKVSERDVEIVRKSLEGNVFQSC